MQALQAWVRRADEEGCASSAAEQIKSPRHRNRSSVSLVYRVSLLLSLFVGVGLFYKATPSLLFGWGIYCFLGGLSKRCVEACYFARYLIGKRACSTAISCCHCALVLDLRTGQRPEHRHNFCVRLPSLTLLQGVT